MAGQDVPLDAIDDPAVVVASDGSVVAANAAARDRWADAPATVADLLADDEDAERVLAAIDDGGWTGDCHLTDGHDRWLASVTIRSIGDDEALLIARDVTEERANERDAKILDAFLAEIPVSVYVKDVATRHVRASDHHAQRIRENQDGVVFHTGKDLEGLTEFDIFPSDLAESAVADDARVIANEETVEGLVERIERPTGDIAHITTAKAPWYDEEGNVVGLMGVSVETTAQRRQAEELKRQNERLEQFASVVSHDLRNPLEVATANLQLYRESDDESHLDTVERMHDRMSQLIDDTLELARGGEPVTNSAPVDVSSVAGEAWSAVDTKDATLLVEWEGTISADRQRLARLLENCFRNAVEHAGDDATVRVVPLADGRTGFAVEDDGPGIPPVERDDVFERGFTTTDDGTGFGLSIVAEIADAHGWHVDVTESRDGGARFEFVTDRED